MLTRLIAASALVLAMGGAAMAQSSDDWWWHRDHRPAASEQVDPYRTGSINGGSGLSTSGNSTGAIGPCADITPGPDANSQQNVNDNYCGK
ncbi:hypothetical protein EOA27_18590 [Mesorhizobium sp. M2A.F.Ca.ET.037.01.1.1]|uniref:hypothetical protein n=1 Tax=unclassified Mesorhizobium TaxID=325217 RepID=UPI000FCBBDA9|nr:MULTISPECIES: hypothetical protein [unclassified Mesorhizobium]RUX83555.1 hypothetical protein EOA25_36560 [Mesorhizobium sp. M2A.F.Ca.ET.040.01.1.1]RUX13646.1 hypothetical protein EOA27_18590 [Mesorhizobium sp. M2A.F.Ca.ET.037.01.1.1]RWA93646.1 MAG: hypothetical protein EOQ31_00670 [Mesorhizobium sp.]RWF32569.1 MAG: hypothetical protein EOS44_15890 [Mesorhizobium sp.]RWX67045.1 hypothetical protein EOA24_16970 [Mesorhizobium sp. M2A.F.Ca.ET.039.01.1.1]